MVPSVNELFREYLRGQGALKMFREQRDVGGPWPAHYALTRGLPWEGVEITKRLRIKAGWDKLLREHYAKWGVWPLKVDMDKI